MSCVLLTRNRSPHVKSNLGLLEGSDCETRDLASLLLDPVRQIARYPALLSSILSHIPEEHPDYGPIRRVVEAMETVADEIQTMAQGEERAVRMAEGESVGGKF